jgi:hypothetical protein
MPIFHKQSSTNNFLFLVGAILVATLGLQLYEHFRPKEPAPLMLAETPDMIHVSTFEEIATHTQTSVSLPEKRFESSLYSIGIYPSGWKTWPANSVSMVFLKDNKRFVVMDVLPNTKLETYLIPYTSYPQESVVINNGNPGKIVHLRNGFNCTHPKEKTTPSMCLITYTLLFEHNGNLIQLSSDGDHITQGEMIEMARSMK